MAHHPYLWPMFRQVHERALRTDLMIERLGTNPASLMRDNNGATYAGVSRTCFECNASERCLRWLQSSDRSKPDFCPNLAALLKFQRRDH